MGKREAWDRSEYEYIEYVDMDVISQCCIDIYHFTILDNQCRCATSLWSLKACIIVTVFLWSNVEANCNASLWLACKAMEQKIEILSTILYFQSPPPPPNCWKKATRQQPWYRKLKTHLWTCIIRMKLIKIDVFFFFGLWLSYTLMKQELD